MSLHNVSTSRINRRDVIPYARAAGSTRTSMRRADCGAPADAKSVVDPTTSSWIFRPDGNVWIRSSE
jgi:hypothetical protein